MKLVVSGIQPSGLIHLGNYLGAIKNWKTLQSSSQSLFLIVDNHAITTSYFKATSGAEVSKDLKTSTYMTAATLKSIGIKNFFIQSQVQEILSLSWILSCMSPMSWFQKMTQFKEKKSALDGASLGIFSYPCLMASDILCFKGTDVPVGEDQTQHLELAADIAKRFNSLFGEFFPIPKANLSKFYSAQATRIMSLRDSTSKMSKSARSDLSRINLLDSQDLIRKKVAKAKTDSIPEVFYDEARPELANLIRIYAEIKALNFEDAGKGWNDVTMFKDALCDALVKELDPVRERTLEIIDSDELKMELRENAERARHIAAKTLEEVNLLVGLR